MVASKSDKPYAVFLSYNGGDRKVVEQIAAYLADKAGLEPWFDQWYLTPGESWIRNLEKGLESSACCAVFIGKSGCGSWQLPEIELALRQHVIDQNFRVIPVLLPDAPQQPKLPAFISGNTWVDFRKGLDDEESRWRLECGIRGVPPGHRKQSTEDKPPPQPTKAPEAGDVDLSSLDIKQAERPAHIFVSYRHHEPDSSLAHLFADALKKAGHEVFIDTGLRWGSDWVKGIREALERSDFLLLLLSKESGASEMVVKEVALARELGNQRNGSPVILPVRLHLPFTDPVPYPLAISLHNIHQELWNGAGDTLRLVKRLLSTVEAGLNWHVDSSPAINTVGEVSTLQPQFDPRSMIIPGGSVKSDSRFYIVREADNKVFTELQTPRALVTVRGPRQTGKTSLIMGMYAALRHAEEPCRTAFIDFQALEGKSLQSRNAIWCAIAAQIAKQLQVEGWKRADWDTEESYVSNISSFLDQFVFAKDETPLLICLDEVDRLFTSPVGSKFFSSVRAFFNSGALDPSWEKVRWLLGSSSEPSFFIDDLAQSPFNIGLRAELGAFTPQEVETFAGRHGLSLDEGLLHKVMDYVGGRPYLVHLMLYHMARSQDRDKLFDTNVGSRAIFRDHLHSYLVGFQRNQNLADAMKKIIKGHDCEDEKLVERLEAAGLVRLDDSKRAAPACRLYAEFFGSQLK
ncbi:MAG: AAA-like domain-containing protein [Pyrinomonadaceae bacterium]|nr:AAA-like domain-containing protein [Pyrinomonadaceae bacterium]